MTDGIALAARRVTAGVGAPSAMLPTLPLCGAGRKPGALPCGANLCGLADEQGELLTRLQVAAQLVPVADLVDIDIEALGDGVERIA